MLTIEILMIAASTVIIVAGIWRLLRQEDETKKQKEYEQIPLQWDYDDCMWYDPETAGSLQSLLEEDPMENNEMFDDF